MVAHDFSLIRRWDSRLRIARVVLSGKCVVHTHSAWTTCCANQQNPSEATFRDSTLIGGTSTKRFPLDGKCTMFVHFPKR